jgi:hypothetical protein
MQLRIAYEYITHPYKEEMSSKGEVWAKIKLQIVDNVEKVIKTVFNTQWNIIEFANWVNENKEFIIMEDMPEAIKADSIAKGIFNFYETVVPELTDDELLDTIYEYRTKHGIRFGLRGLEVEDVYVGILNKRMTISFCNETDSWNYNVDIVPFLNQIDKIKKETHSAIW